MNDLLLEFSNSGFKIFQEHKDLDIYTKLKVCDIDGYMYLLSIRMIRTNIRLNRGYDKISIRNPFTIDNIKIASANKNISAELVSDVYQGNKDKLTWKCQCGNIFHRTFGNVVGLGRDMCEECGAKKSNMATMSKRHDYEHVKSMFKSKGYILLESEYTNANIKMKCIDDDGFLYETRYDDLVNSNATPYKFHPSNKYTIKNIHHYIDINNIDCLLLSNKYENYSHLLRFECRCGNHFKTDLSHFIYDNKFRCDRCSKKQSIISLKTEEWLITKEIIYEKEVSFSDLKSVNNKPLRYDFYIKDLNILIEVDGKQHYEKAWGVSDEQFKESINRDKLKDDYAEQNKIKLIRIPYYMYDNDDYIKKLEKDILNTVSK